MGDHLAWETGSGNTHLGRYTQYERIVLRDENPDFSWFVKSFTSIYSELRSSRRSAYQKLHKNQLQAFENLTGEERTGMKTLQKRLITPLILSVPSVKGKPAVDNNACDKQVGAVLPQYQPYRLWKPIGYWPRLISQAEWTYYASEH